MDAAAAFLAEAPASGGHVVIMAAVQEVMSSTGHDAPEHQATSGALGLATVGAGRLAMADQDGDDLLLDGLGMEMAPDVQPDQALPIDDAARARLLLPTICHPAIEYNLPVVEVERYKSNALDLLFHAISVLNIGCSICIYLVLVQGSSKSRFLLFLGLK